MKIILATLWVCLLSLYALFRLSPITDGLLFWIMVIVTIPSVRIISKVAARVALAKEIGIRLNEVGNVPLNQSFAFTVLCTLPNGDKIITCSLLQNDINPGLVLVPNTVGDVGDVGDSGTGLFRKHESEIGSVYCFSELGKVSI